MMPWTKCVLLLLVVGAIRGVFQSTVLNRRPCTPLQDKVKHTALILQSRWFNADNAAYSGGSFWTDANEVEALVNAVEVLDGCDDMVLARTAKNDIDVMFFSKAQNVLKQPYYFDDVMWWALAWLRAGEVFGRPEYISRARDVLDVVERRAWSEDECSGGVFWTQSRNAKNAITNELYIALSAKIALLSRQVSDSARAYKAFEWFRRSGLVNQQHLINDGLDDSCANNGGIEWTYNQGVILGACASLYELSGQRSYIDFAVPIANAALHRLVDCNGVLQDVCERSSTGCSETARQFKGVFMRHLAYLSAVVEAAAVPTRLHVHALQQWRNASAHMATMLWTRDRDQFGMFGSRWSGPPDGSGPARQGAALDLLNAVAVAELAYSHRH